MKRSTIYLQYLSTSNYQLEFLSFYQFPRFLQNKTIKINVNVNPDFLMFQAKENLDSKKPKPEF